MKEREDECFSCGDAGQLVSCKKPGCPKVYHADCLNLTKRPAGQCTGHGSLAVLPAGAGVAPGSAQAWGPRGSHQPWVSRCGWDRDRGTPSAPNLGADCVELLGGKSRSC